MIRLCLLLLTLVAATHTLAAQSAAGPAVATSAPDSTVEVRLRDGSVLYGRIAERSESRVVLVTSSGVRLELEMLQVLSIRTVRTRGSDGRYWAPDPNATRLFFSSTARPLAKGEGYISSYFLFVPMVAYGVTDRITLAGGTPVLPGAFGELWYFAPKVTLLNREQLSVAVGALGLWFPSAADGESVGIVYGSSTIGSPDLALTVGAGWGYFTDGGTTEFSNRPVIMLGGETRTAASVKLISENWLAFDGPTVNGIVSGGVRFIGPRLSADLGLGMAVGDGGCCLPMVNFVYSFGNRAR
jgi:hypothetical protein